MTKHPRLIHLLLILLALAALAAGAWFYTNASDPVADVKPPSAPRPSDSATSSPGGLDAVLYFPNSKLGSDEDCTKVFPVHREIVDTINDSALLELLKGPTEEEKALGYLTSIPDGVTVNSIVKRKAAGGTVVIVDFGDALNRVAGSCRVMSIRAQIEQTVQAMDPLGKTSVIISVDGDATTSLQP